MQFFVREVYPVMAHGQVSIPSKQVVLFQKTDKRQKKVLARFDLFSIDLQQESRMHAEMLTLFLNSKECTKKLRKAFLDSISKPSEKGGEKPVLSMKSLNKLDRSIAIFSLLERAREKV